MSRILCAVGLLAFVLAAGCEPLAPGPGLLLLPAEPAPAGQSHESRDESLPEIARAPECKQLSYATLQRILESRGFERLNPAADSAGSLFRSSRTVFGDELMPNDRSDPPHLWPVAAMRLFDILLAAAPEIIENMPKHSECQLGGSRAVLFDGNSCAPEGFSCLLGVPATPALLKECNALVQAAPDPTTGKRLAMAALAAPFYLCE
jgi:hypothetical protein